MIGRSPAFMAVLKRIERLAAYDAPVLIEGETGTGKELAAYAIHYGGRRRDKPFIPVNCGALPETLIENELFGHARGAFTDARAAGAGLLHHAHRGTLFLDEVDALPMRGQAVLLRFLQDGRFRPLGAQHEEIADVRVIVASNSRLESLAEQGSFRADLLFRLRVLVLLMPPLRERPGDPLLLAEHFLGECARRYGGSQRVLDTKTHGWLDLYSWPGNVRELENLIHREFLLSEGTEIHIDPPASQLLSALRNNPILPEPSGATPTYAIARNQALAAFDHAYLTDLLRQTRGNVSQAARIAGKERRALGKLLKRYDLCSAAFRD